jgi:pimeloyl-ACP methyl ester carboxylesterase
MTSTVTSADGTVIAYDRSGRGPALILVDASGHYRAFSSFAGLVPRLAEDFTVVHYDRRGRGESGDTAPYAVQREVEDLAALVAAVGGTAYLHGFSSGALLALHAVASGLPVPRLSVVEPPVELDEDRAAQQAFIDGIAARVAAGDLGAAVEFNLTEVGVPAEIVAGMRGGPAWAAMEAVAPTLVYDGMISAAMSVERLARVRVPTLVLGSTGSEDDLGPMTAAVAGALPDAEHRTLAGEWHGIADDVLASTLREFFLRTDPT